MGEGIGKGVDEAHMVSNSRMGGSRREGMDRQGWLDIDAAEVVALLFGVRITVFTSQAKRLAWFPQDAAREAMWGEYLVPIILNEGGDDRGITVYHGGDHFEALVDAKKRDMHVNEDQVEVEGENGEVGGTDPMEAEL
jgi:hypothetical protein